jgi:hypothetical protein
VVKEHRERKSDFIYLDDGQHGVLLRICEAASVFWSWLRTRNLEEKHSSAASIIDSGGKEEESPRDATSPTQEKTPRREEASPRPTRGYYSPPPPVVTTPTFTVSWPDDFPQSARDDVYDAYVDATQEFDRGKASVRYEHDVKPLALTWIRRIFAEFTKLGHMLGIQKVWKADRFESESLKFFDELARVVYLSGNGRFVRTDIEHSDEWQEFRRQLGKVVEARSAEGKDPQPVGAKAITGEAAQEASTTSSGAGRPTGSDRPNAEIDKTEAPQGRPEQTAPIGSSRKKRGPAADNEGHIRVAELLPDDWENDLPGTLKKLAAPQDGGPPVEPSPGWKRKYNITSYADLVTDKGTVDVIDEKLIKQHITRRKECGQKKLSETLGNSRTLTRVSLGPTPSMT